MVNGLAERLTALPRERTQTLPALHILHAVTGYLPPDGLEQVGAWLHVPKSELYAVAMSYSEFRFQPLEAGAVRVCRGLSCRIAGSAALASALREMGRPVEECECLFACAVAPVAEVEGRLIGRSEAEALG